MLIVLFPTMFACGAMFHGCNLPVLQSLKCSPPDVMTLALQARGHYQTAEVDWALRMANESDDRLYSAKYAGARFLYTSRGTSTGQRIPGADRTGTLFAFAEERVLWEEERQWEYTEESFNVTLSIDAATQPTIFDPMLVGFAESIASPASPGAHLPDSVKRYEVRQVDERWEVTAVLDEDSGVRRIWVLDPAVGMQPVVSSGWLDGEEVNRSETMYELRDGRWLPSQCQYYTFGELTASLEIVSQSFDQPWHDQELTPNDLGLMPCISVNTLGRPVMLWDGQKPITVDEMYERQQRNEVDLGPILSLQERRKAGIAPRCYPDRGDEDDGFGLGAAVKLTPSLWETYVRRFIAFYRLDKEQTKKAWEHHGECQSAYFDFAKEREDELQELRGRVADLEKKSARTESEAASLADSLKRLDAIEGYKAKVFDERLKPGLLKLPTEGQVKAAKDRVAAIKVSKPSGAASSLTPSQAPAKQPGG